MKNLFFIIAIIVAVLFGMKMLGWNDVVSNIGSKVRAKADGIRGGSKSRDNQEDGKSAMSKEVFGWDIKDIQTKPDVVVRAGKEKLQRLIEDLEQLKFSSRLSGREIQLKNSEARQEMEDLREAIRTAKAYLEDENTKYPVKIKTYTYPSKASLHAAVGNALSRYNALKRFNGYPPPEPRSEQLIAEVNQRLTTAAALMAELDAKLDHATIKVQENALGNAAKKLRRLEAEGTAVLPPDDEIRLPSGVTSDKERIDRMLKDFND